MDGITAGTYSDTRHGYRSFVSDHANGWTVFVDVDGVPHLFVGDKPASDADRVDASE